MNDPPRPPQSPPSLHPPKPPGDLPPRSSLRTSHLCLSLSLSQSCRSDPGPAALPTPKTRDSTPTTPTDPSGSTGPRPPPESCACDARLSGPLLAPGRTTTVNFAGTSPREPRGLVPSGSPKSKRFTPSTENQDPPKGRDPTPTSTTPGKVRASDPTRTLHYSREIGKVMTCDGSGLYVRSSPPWDRRETRVLPTVPVYLRARPSEGRPGRDTVALTPYTSECPIRL